MARVTTDPYTIMANVVEQVILDEFDDETYMNVLHDRIHESLGSDGQLWIGLSPVSEPTTGIDMTIELLIQFYGPFIADVNPAQMFDPRTTTNKAERLRQALSESRTIGQSKVWFFDVTNTSYPSDATGNKTRFEMTVVGRGNNSALVETTG